MDYTREKNQGSFRLITLKNIPASGSFLQYLSDTNHLTSGFHCPLEYNGYMSQKRRQK